MPDVSRRIFILTPPADQPELHPHFAALASQDGYRLHFLAKDKETGETAIVQIEPHPEGGDTLPHLGPSPNS
jgi:hypothetical protein